MLRISYPYIFDVTYAEEPEEEEPELVGRVEVDARHRVVLHPFESRFVEELRQALREIEEQESLLLDLNELIEEADGSYMHESRSMLVGRQDPEYGLAVRSTLASDYGFESATETDKA